MLDINDCKKQKLRKKRTEKIDPEKLNITNARKNKLRDDFVAFKIITLPLGPYSKVTAPNKSPAAMETTIIVSLK